MEKPIFQLDPYLSEGKKGLAIRLDIRDMVRVPDAHPRIGWRMSMLSSKKTQMWYGPSSPDALRQQLADWQVPEEIARSARRMAGRITQAFDNVTHATIDRHQISGRLDSRKLSTLVQTSLNGTYTAEDVRPYRRRQPMRSRRPVIAILTSAGDGEVVNRDYLPKVMPLTLGVQWAAEAAGFEVYNALTLGKTNVSAASGYQQAVMVYMTAQPGMNYSPRNYAAAMHTQEWWPCLIALIQADYAYASHLSMLDHGTPEWDKRNTPGLFICANGGPAAGWAREHLQADILITIGDISDRHLADIQLEVSYDLDQTVREIIRQTDKL